VLWLRGVKFDWTVDLRSIRSLLLAVLIVAVIAGGTVLRWRSMHFLELSSGIAGSIDRTANEHRGVGMRLLRDSSQDRGGCQQMLPQAAVFALLAYPPGFD
jgi:hypothetical protein